MIVHGTFAYLPDLTDDEIEAQLRYALGQGWAVSVELTDDPHPRNALWDMWALPMFDLTDPAGALAEIRACREAFPDRYIRVNAFDASSGRETVALSFLVQRPAVEAKLALDRQSRPGRTIGYTLRAAVADRHAEP